MIGQAVGRYRILDKLGEGGMGEVYLAEDRTLGRRVALKFLSPALCEDEIARRRFLLEAKSAAALDHPFICKVFEADHADGYDYIAMEFVSGTTLKERIAQGPLPLDEFFGLAGEVTEALEEAHTRRIIHRDLKPANIMLTLQGHAKVMDFGLAKRLEEGLGTPDQSPTRGLTRQGAAVGTLPYMAPEQIAGEQVDVRSDLFSLGVVFYEALTGRHPFRRANAMETVGAILQEDPAPAKNPGGEIPERLEACLRRMLAKDPARRTQSVVEVRAGLAEAFEQWASESGRARSGKPDAGAQARRRALSGGLTELRPYPGLSPFTEREAGQFFGREDEVAALWERIRTSDLLGVIGPSGTGKTSFLRAGILAGRPSGWGAIYATPGSNPVLGLARALSSDLAGDAESVGELLSGVTELAQGGRPDRVVQVVRNWRRLYEDAVVVVDQFEELFTLNPVPVQEQFAQLLGDLASVAGVRILLSMRDDFLIRCSDHPALVRVFDSLTPLTALRTEGLRRALSEPARQRGYRFEDDALVDEMLGSVAGERGALPLLAFSVSRLWERRDRQRRLLTRQAYLEIGGVAGALAQHAEATLERIGPEGSVIVREIFRNLVTAQGTRAVMERNELLSAFPDRSSAEEVLNLLVAARLLMTYEVTGREGEATRHRVEVVHESLLKAWPRLVRWQAQDEEGAVLRDQLRQAAHLWEEKGRTQDLLWSGTAHREYELWRQRYSGALTALEEDFARAMSDRARRRTRLRRGFLAAAFAVLVLVTGTVTISRQQTMQALEQARSEAVRAEASKLLAIAQTKLEVDPAEAVAYVTTSLELMDTEAARLFAVRSLAEALPLFELEAGFLLAWYPAFSPGGGRLAVVGSSSEGAVFDHDGSLLTRLAGLDPHPSSNKPVWARDDLLLVGVADGAAEEVLAWELPQGRRLRSISLGSRSWWTAGFGRLYAASEESNEKGSRAATIRAWELPQGLEQPSSRILRSGLDLQTDWFMPGLDGLLYAQDDRVYCRPIPRRGGPDRLLLQNGTRISGLGHFAGTNRLWIRDQQGRIRTFATEGLALKTVSEVPGPPETPRDMVPEASGRWLWKPPTQELAAEVWAMGNLPGSRPMRLRRETSWYFSKCGMHPSGSWAVCALGQEPAGQVAFWALPERPTSIVDNCRSIWRLVAFSPDSRWLATTWENKGLRLWSMPGTGVLEARQLPVPSTHWTGLAFDPTGRNLFAAGRGHVVSIPVSGGPLRGFAAFPEEVLVYGFTVSPNGSQLAGAGGFGTERKFLRIWDTDRGSFRDFPLPLPLAHQDGREEEPTGYEGAVFSLLFDGENRLYSAGHGGIRRWDLDTGIQTLVREGNWVKMWPIGPGPTVCARFAPRPGGQGPHHNEVLNLATGESRTAPELGSFGDSLFPGALSAEQSVLAGAGYDGLVKVGRIDGGTPQILSGHRGPAQSVAISPDLRWVASTGQDNTLRLWPMPDLSRTPVHALPREELILKLKSMTNLRAVPDPGVQAGWKIIRDRFPGWKEVPTW